VPPRRETDRFAMAKGRVTWWGLAILILSAFVFWVLGIVNGAFVVSGRVIVCGDGCGRRPGRADGENLRWSDPFAVCRYDLFPLHDFGGGRHQCSRYGFDAASDLWSRLWQRHPFCETGCLCHRQALCCDVGLEYLSLEPGGYRHPYTRTKGSQDILELCSDILQQMS
jgi:hypothetical protein